MSRTAVIVGAGMGGLSAAVELSGRSGWDVTVLEAASEPGGKVGVEEHDGVEFGTGPSLLTLVSMVNELSAGQGRSLASELELLRPSPATRYLFADGSSFDVGTSPQQTRENIRRAFGGQAAREFDDFLGYCRRIWEAAAPHFVKAPAPTVLSAMRWGLTAMRDFLAIDSTKTMEEVVEAKISDGRLRDVFLRYATFNGSDPRRAPATLLCIAWVDLGLGVRGVRGGMYELVRAMEQMARDGGGELVYDRPVTAIRPCGDGYDVCWQGGSTRADAVIVNADVRHFVDGLWDSTVDHGISVAGRSSTSGWTAVIRARRRPNRRRPAHTVVFPERDYLLEFHDLFDKESAPEEPTIYLCAPEKAHKTDGWQNHEPLFAMINAPAVADEKSGVDWKIREEQVMRRLRHRGLVSDGDRIIWRRTPAQLARRFPDTGGSIYGAASNSRLAAFRRPPNRAPGVEGLYFASGSVHPGGGVPLAIESGRRAAGELLEDFP